MKFRVWDKLEKRMISTNEAILKDDNNDGKFRNLVLNPVGNVMVFDESHSLYMEYKLVVGTVYEPLFYADFKDKTGKLCCQGDIVKLLWKNVPYEGCDEDEITTEEIICVVEYHDSCFWLTRPGVLSENCHFHYNDSDREIIGTIQENPELCPWKEK